MIKIKGKKKDNNFLEKHDEGKVLAIISYIGWVGFILSFVLNQDKKNDFARFHIRQSLFLNILSLMGFFLHLIPFVSSLFFIALFILWLLGLLSAIKGEKKELPLIGNYVQDLFKNL